MEGTVDALGRITIPKSLRERLGLSPGSRVRIEADGSRVLIEPTEGGDLVWDGNGMPLLQAPVPPGYDVLGAIRAGREERSEEVSGWKPS